MHDKHACAACTPRRQNGSTIMMILRMGSKRERDEVEERNKAKDK
jgi:hypothetical protein